MNYYPFHLGDYAAHTAHLTWEEDLAYRRLLDLYYLHEKPVPADVQKLARLVRMPKQVPAIEAVLAEFFELRDDGWHNKRADDELARMSEKAEATEERDKHEKTRMQRYRERRSTMFEALRGVGVIPPFDIGQKELQRLFDTHCNGHETSPRRNGDVSGDAPATAIPTPTPTPTPTPEEKKGADAPLSAKRPTVVVPIDQDLPDMPGVPACPVRQLVGLYAAKCTSLPKPRFELWKDSQGAKDLRTRWRWLLSADAVREDGTRYAETPAQAIDWFGRFFDTVHASDFLTGRKGNWGKCDLSWLMKRENFMKVVQGNYDNERAAA